MSIQHENATQIHKFAYIGTADPGAVGAGKAWVDTNFNPRKFWIRNTTNTGWEPIGLGNTSYAPYGGGALRDMEAYSMPPYDFPNGMIMMYRPDSARWQPSTVGELRFWANLSEVPNVDARARATHTGTQLASTISNFNSAVDARITANTLQKSVVVSGAGTTSVNGVYTERVGLYNAKPYYVKEGVATTQSANVILVDNYFGSGNNWVILDSSGTALYEDITAADYPWNGFWWKPGTSPGSDPAPVVSEAGLEYARINLHPQTVLAPTTLTFYQSTGAGSYRYNLYGNDALTANTGITLPVSTIGPADELAVKDGIQSLANKTIAVNTLNSHLTNNTAVGTTISNINAGATISQWGAVYLGSGGKWLAADANGSGTYPARGIATYPLVNNLTAEILVTGVVRNDAWTWTPGGTIYLSTTAGAFTQTAPATTGDKVQAVGFALTATKAYFNFTSFYTTV